LHTSERLDFILGASIRFGLFCKGRFIQIVAFDHPIKIATIHLQGNPKPKMMPAAKIFRQSVRDFPSVAAAAPATTKRIYSNDQHVDTFGNAWGVDDSGDIRNCGTASCASAEPGTT
jgi:hypothetical protein